MNKNATDLIRKVEREVLDTYHRTFALLRRSQKVAIVNLLRIHGNSLREMRRSYAASTDTAIITRLNALTAGTTQAIRWALTETEANGDNYTVATPQLDRETMDLWVWATNYMSLAADHIAWSRGVLAAAVDENTRTISFHPSRDYDHSFFIGQLFSWQKQFEYFLTSAPAPALAALYREWTRRMRRDESGIHIPPDFATRIRPMGTLLEWARSRILPEIDAESDFAGYTLREFCRVYAVLWTHAFCICAFEDAYDQRYGETHDLGSSCFTMPAKEAYEWLARGCDLSKTIVSEIVKDLAFNHASIHSSFAFQPIVMTSDQWVVISPRVFMTTDPYRMLSGALQSGKRRHCYEAIANSLEASRVEQIANAFSTRGFTVAQKHRLSSNRRTGTPDLVVYSDGDNELLLIEYKHSISPPEPAMVAKRLMEADKWVSRLLLYRDLLSRDRQARARLGCRVPTGPSYLLLLYGFPMMMPLGTTGDVAVGDWTSVHEIITENPRLTLSGLWRWAKERPDVAHLSKAATNVFQEIKVGEWTYVHPVIALEDGDYRQRQGRP